MANAFYKQAAPTELMGLRIFPTSQTGVRTMNFFRWKQRKEEELDAEIRSHLDEAIRDGIARGEMPDEARAHALREFGNVGLVKEVTREMWCWASLERLGQDLRFGLRMLRKNPGFSLVAIMTLALGIGANTAIFSVVNAVMLSPLPYHESEQLVTLRVRGNESAAERRLTAPEWTALKERSEFFQQVAAFEPKDFTLTTNDAAEPVKAVQISSELLPLLGVQPQRGRMFAADEFQPGHAPVVLISHRLWQNRFGSDDQIVGRTTTLNEQSYVIVGVLPPGFDFFPAADLLAPLTLDAKQLSNQLAGVYDVVARLKSGVTVEQTQRALSETTRQSDQAAGLRVYSLRVLLA
jgi:putative ABC transport system permease protein